MMLKLIKYEFMKRQKFILTALAILALVECGILFGIYKGGGFLAMAVIFVFLLIYGAIIFVFVDTLRSYSFDLNSKQGYQLFLTPTSGYKIIATKAIIGFIELIAFACIVFAFMVINYEVVKILYYDNMNEVFREVLAVIDQANLFPDMGEIVIMVLVAIFEWFTVIMVAVLAMTLRKTVLSNSKLGWLISLVFFVAIYSLLEIITLTVLAPLGFYNDIFDMMLVTNKVQVAQGVTINNSPIGFNIFKYLLASACIYPIYLVVLYFFSGKLLNKRVDL